MVYGAEERAFRESDCMHPASSRGAAKACAALWLRQYAGPTGFPAWNENGDFAYARAC